MKKTIFIIIVLLGFIVGVGYYGYTIILAPGSLSETVVEGTLSEIDLGTEDMQNQGLSDETVADIDGVATSSTALAVAPATTAEIDIILAELNTFSVSDTSSYNTSLADL